MSDDFLFNKMDGPGSSSNSAQVPKKPVMESVALSVSESLSATTSILDGEKSTCEKRDGNSEGRGRKSRGGRPRGIERGGAFSRNKRSDMGRAEWR